MTRMSSITRMAVGLSIGVLISTSVAAQVWPTRPITMVVPFAAGGSVDIVGRILASGLSQVLGKPVIVENLGGAGGMMGADRVAKAVPDGYQLVLGSTGNFAQSQALYKNPLYNPSTDFVPVALITTQAIVLVVRKDLPANNLQDFIAYTKANQAKMQYGSAGAGSGTHLACVLLNAAVDLQVTHVPYRGGGLAMQDLIAGRIDYQCPLNTIVMPQLESHTIKAIAVLGERSPSLPGLASAREQGVANVDIAYWCAIFLPRTTPTIIVQKLHDAVLATMNNPTVQGQMKEIGVDLVAPDRRSPEYLKTFVESEIKKWEAPIKASGVTLD
jgi:tripartite-type tricarboxylate transporter receptor subunit TctC